MSGVVHDGALQIAGHNVEQVVRVCELLLTENYGLLTGAFERDTADGKVRFRIGLPLRGASLTQEQVNRCMGIAVVTTAIGFRKI